tara:strand:- start:45116 stop:46024 length:909 start_codon:yes stop_codon:yes gene_type:complete
LTINSNQNNTPEPIHRGKVRDTYDIGNGYLLMVASDRISAYDVVLPTIIPYKGLILSKLSEYWFNNTNHLIPNHLICLGDNEAEISKINTAVPLDLFPTEILSKGMVVKKANRIDIECVVRGYITGSAWSEYQKTGTVSGVKMPSGMKEGDPFPEPLFTPTTKAETGHDLPMSMDEVREMVGSEMADKLQAVTTEIYTYAHDESEIKGIIVADTKMEFGIVESKLTLIDELITPDSSRFWDKALYSPGKSQPSFDKQYVRDWLTESGWDREPPGPELPDEIVNETLERYIEAYERITGTSWS